jgi:hypothetical protein
VGIRVHVEDTLIMKEVSVTIILTWPAFSHSVLGLNTLPPKWQNPLFRGVNKRVRRDAKNNGYLVTANDHTFD